MHKSMMAFLMVNGLRRVFYRRGRTYKQLPALKQSLAQIVNLLSLGATRYQAFSFFKTKIVLGAFCLSFFILLPQNAYSQSNQPTPAKQNINQTQNQIAQTSSPTADLAPSTPPVSTPPQPTTNFQLPHPGYITTTFSSYHPGIDLCIGIGMPIKPIAEGIISEAGFNIWGLGLMVEVDHKNGFKSLYAHMGKIFVNKGQEINKDSLLGEVGMTGHTSGPHTHLELSYNRQKIDPRPLLPEIRNYPKQEDFISYQSSTPSAIIAPTQPIASESAANQSSNTNTSIKEQVTKENKFTVEKIAKETLTILLKSDEASKTPLPNLILLPKSLPKNEPENLTTISNPDLYFTPDTKQLLIYSKIAEKNLEKILSYTNTQLVPEILPKEEKTNLLTWNLLVK